MIASLFSRFRVLSVALSISICLMVFSLANLHYQPYSIGWLRLVDVSFWLLSVGSVAAGLLDLSLFWRRSPLLSTLLFTAVGMGIVIVARVSSAIYSLLKTSFYTQLIGGSVIDDISYKLVSTAILGSFILLASTAVSTLYREPVVFRKGPTLYSSLMRVVKAFSGTGLKLLYVASFAIGFAVRLYPELKYLDLPVGWDTLEYISVARDFSYQPKALTTYLWLGWWRNLPPLLTWIPGLLALAGIDPWFFFKIYPPITVGIMSMLTAAITYRLSNSKWVALASSLLASFNPYILGQSQQWHRHVLGALTLLAYIYLCENEVSLPHRALILTTAALSYEPAAVIALLLSIAEAAASRNWRSRGAFALSTTLSLLALLWYVCFPQTPITALTSTGVYVAGGMEYYPGSAFGYTITCTLLLTPSLAMILIWKRMDWRARLSIVILSTAFMLPILSVVAPVDQHRWFTILLTLVTPYTVAGLAKLSRSFLVLATLIIVVLGSAYPFTESGFTHFEIWSRVSTVFAKGYPWKMAPALTNITDVENAAKIIEANGDIVLIRLSLYPQFHLYIRNPVNIVVVNQDPKLPTAIRYAVSEGSSRVLVVTAINMSKQLEEFKARPDFYNATMLLQLGEERIVSIDRIKCEVLYRGNEFSIYVVEISENTEKRLT